MGRDALRFILFLFSLLIFASGFAVGIVLFEQYLLPSMPASRVLLDLTEVFITIFFRNIIVGILISILGFVTAGLSTMIVLFWNGLLTGRYFNTPSSDLWEVSQYFIYHGGFELVAFFLFGAIGLRGILVFKSLMVTETIDQSLKFSVKEFVWPVALLLVAATIESLLIVYS